MKNINYPILGYAPGMYQNTCMVCNEEYMGDKYSRMCETCAINKLNESHSLLLKENKDLKSVLEKIKDVKQFFNNLDMDLDS